jgi:UDP-N-acetylglucosamine transferase subunit ALG13
MIFVTVGTNEARFDRLLTAVDEIGAQEELIVQHGPSAVRPAGATSVDFLSFDEMVETMRRARIVVTHAGVGSVMTSLLASTRPIVVPRLHRFGEAVDDHQLPFGRRLAEAGLVVLCEEPDELAQVVARGSGQLDVELRPSRRLVGDLRDYLLATIEPLGDPQAPD